ncbi:CDP-glycerol glycerophosphotransferase family protein [Methanosphaera sp. WGK6]|uniref:bifunctional glycosyltransferase/CDP-glycerol:glycerophosphate glycerophosphotransferase n=1 Tax=Methanosphaera sp. WGK6 TaxID=1561964 RepID=UPI00084C896A|nr:CDP-glycerol glycerophosphotransferase family protein [Methanosphaera sp. WGK6]
MNITNNIKKDKQFKFSIVMSIYNVEDYINEAIDSIINQTLDFNENIQLILVDDGSCDNSTKILQEYQRKYPSNITLIIKENEGQGPSRNRGLEYVQGRYVNFLDSDDYLTPETLENVYQFFKKHEKEIDIVAIPMYLCDKSTGPHRLNDKFKKTRIIDLEIEPNNPQLSTSSAFFKKEVFDKFKFPTNLVSSEDAYILAQILLEKKKYGVVKEAKYYYRQRFDSTSTTDDMINQKEYYIPRLTDYFIGLINYDISLDNKVCEYIKFLMAYELQWLLQLPNTDILTDDEKIEFWNKLDYVLEFIDEENIDKNIYIQQPLQAFFIYLKNRQHKINLEDNKVVLKTNQYLIDTLDKHKIWLDIVEIRDGYLNISGLFSSNFKNDTIDIYLVCEDEKINVIKCRKVKYTNPSRLTKSYLSINWLYRYAFDVEVPLPHIHESKYTFKIIYTENTIVHTFKPWIGFNGTCNLSAFSRYQVNNNKICTLENGSFTIKEATTPRTIKAELKDLKEQIHRIPEGFYKAVPFRIVYNIIQKLYKNKDVWLFSDRPDFADDNAKCLFEYATTQDDNITKYFIINKDSPDYNKLRKKHENIIKHGSLKHKILYLTAQKNISSYVNENFINPFYDDNYSLYKGLNTSHQYFLQHGVTKDDVSYFISKYNKNLTMINTVSDYEQQSFMSEGYNFNKERIPVLGFPRYDNLNNKQTQKQILYMPTWRMQLENELVFKNSQYKQTLENFLNNKQLHKILEKEGYKIVFRPHPELVKYMDLINIHENINVVMDKSYQELFNESALLVTDYSSVYFDFAYLKKPVIYYHADENYHYEEGYFNYENMGFGEVIKKEEDLVKKIEDYLYLNCQMEEKYVKRVKDFFKYTDQNNCKRVYEWIYEN